MKVNNIKESFVRTTVSFDLGKNEGHMPSSWRSRKADDDLAVYRN